MNSIPYLYINLIALCCYMIILSAFLAAKKTPEIWSFIIMIFAFMGWIGGSVLMRLQVTPGVEFWYYVSIMSLFSIATLIYWFVCSFAKVSGYFLKILWSVLTVVMLVFTSTGVFLKPPKVSIVNGGTVFTYDVNWFAIAIPTALIAVIVLSVVQVLRREIKKKGFRAPGLGYILAGCLVCAVGNLMQIIPGNTFPYDTLSAIFFAALLIIALYKKHMFRLTLQISESVLMLVLTLICFIAAIYFVDSIDGFVIRTFPLFKNSSTAIVVVFFTICFSICYFCMRHLVKTLFVREEKQNQLLKDFSNNISQTLNSGEIFEALARIIADQVSADQVYICLLDEEKYAVRYCISPLAPKDFFLRKDSPVVNYLKEEDYLLISEFRGSPYYLSLWDSEKAVFRDYDVQCIVPLKDNGEVTGLALLSSKNKNAKYTFGEMNFITTSCSIASIAVKNAQMYERMFREARIDSLTGVFNYRYFVEQAEKLFREDPKRSLALIYVDIDDFKLYNQLFGSSAGDQALKIVADIITRYVGTAGTVSRSSGKVFAILLPGYDGRQAFALSENIREGVMKLNCGFADQRRTKPLTVSCGICVSPYAASCAKELIEKADIARNNAKNTGKNKTEMSHGTELATTRASDRAHEIIDHAEHDIFRDSGNANTIYALIAAIDAKDHYTCQHSMQVATYASILATAIGLSDDQVMLIYNAGLLHDIGKISIPENILCKTSRLTDEERDIIKGHVMSSIEIIRHLPSMDYLIPAAIGHHERWDGNGYPRGIAGTDIPVTARCMAIADSFDAMTSDRPYRKGMEVKAAIEQLEVNAGTQFDPVLVGKFVELVKLGDIAVK